MLGSLFDKTLQTANTWLKKIMGATGLDRRRAYRVRRREGNAISPRAIRWSSTEDSARRSILRVDRADVIQCGYDGRQIFFLMAQPLGLSAGMPLTAVEAARTAPQQASRAAMSCDLGLAVRAIIGGAAGKFRGGDLAAAPGAASTLLPVGD